MQSAPLVVDLDGTLLRTDTLFEAFASALLRRPLAALASLPLAVTNRAQLKRRILELAELDVETLPLRDDLIEYLRAERSRGRSLHLVTAADQSIADRVAKRVGVFDDALGSDGEHNLKGGAKRDALVERFPDGYAYAGDSAADLPVWRSSQSIVLAGASGGVARRARGLGVEIEAEFPDTSRRFRAWRKAFRLHQWSKNILIFAPMFLAHRYDDAQAWVAVIAGFFIASITASATYLINDLVDLSADRRHRSKKSRPLASGDLPIMQALIVGPVVVAAGVVSAFVLEPAFGGVLLAYVATTFAYSLYLKRLAMIDVYALAFLFTSRLAMGATLAHAPLTIWLVTFSMFFFFSLSLAKRHVEIVSASADLPADAKIKGRGYLRRDEPITLAFGVGAALASIVILVLYLAEEAFPSGTYSSPEWLWLVPALIAGWTNRVWLLAHRGELHDDPIVFAIKDRVSVALGATIVGVFAAAVFL